MEMDEPNQADQEHDSSNEIFQTYLVGKSMRCNSCDNLQTFEQNQIKIRNIFRKLPDFDKKQICIEEERYNSQQKGLIGEVKQKYFRSKSQDCYQKFQKSQSNNQQDNFKLIKLKQIQLRKVKNLIIHKKEDWCSDTLQLEEFNFQLTSFGLSRAPLLSMAPIVAYYTYSILLNNIQLASLLYKNDQKLIEFYNIFKENKNLIAKLKIQTLTQLSVNQIIQKMSDFNDQNILLALIPETINIDALDTNTILKDFIHYSNAYIDCKQNILDSLQPTFIYRKNNVLLAFVRFVFLNKNTNQSINYRFPVSQFDEVQFLDFYSFEKLQVEDDQVNNFLKRPHFHSEKSLTQYLILDAMKDKKLFKQLKQTFNQELIDESQLTLNQIQLEITSELRICSFCVRMFEGFPIQFYFEMLKDWFKFNLNDKLYLIILSQFLSNPRYRISDDQQQENQLMSKIVEVKYKSKVNLENNKQLQECEENKRLFIAQLELEPTGLLSNQFFLQRYLLQGQQCFKTPINDVLLNNTFFISSSEDESERLSQQLNQINKQQIDQFKNQVEINENKSNLQSKKSCENQSKRSLEKNNQLLVKLNEFKQMFQATKLSQQLNQTSIMQEEQLSKTFEQIIEELKTTFLSTIIKNNSQLKLEKYMKQLGFFSFGNSFTQMLAQLFVNEYKNDLFLAGILFNKDINRKLMIKDHQFLNKYISPLNAQQFDENHGSHYTICSLQLICKNGESQKLEISEFLQTTLIENCTNFYLQIKEFINQNQFSTLNQYHIIVLSTEIIKKNCMKEITQLLCSDEELEKIMISFQFIHFNLFQESYSYVNSFQQNQNTFEIKIVNYNPSTKEELTNRYKVSKEFNRENISYCDTQSLTNLSQFKCNVHNNERRKDQA